MNECIICFSDTTSYLHSKKKLIKLDQQNYYKKNCKCNPYIHNDCLKKWIIIENKCPICRNNIIMKKTLTPFKTIILILEKSVYFIVITYNIALFFIFSFYLFILFPIIIVSKIYENKLL